MRVDCVGGAGWSTWVTGIGIAVAVGVIVEASDEPLPLPLAVSPLSLSLSLLPIPSLGIPILLPVVDPLVLLARCSDQVQTKDNLSHLGQVEVSLVGSLGPAHRIYTKLHKLQSNSFIHFKSSRRRTFRLRHGRQALRIRSDVTVLLDPAAVSVHEQAALLVWHEVHFGRFPSHVI
jgi:hypothetical protein